MKNIPNILTIIRLLLIPFILISINYDNYLLSIILFTISSITDVLDGIIARKFNFISNFGKLMDPLADKLTQVFIILALTIKDIIPEWIVIAIMIKELIMVLGSLFLYKKKDVVVSSKWYGKLTTVLIYLAVVSSFLIKQVPKLGFKIYFLGYHINFDMILYILALIFALFSLLSYISFWGRKLLKKK